MDAIKLLKKQHDEVEALFKKFDHAEEISEKQEIFETIADNLAAHATIEEKIFYPVAYRDGDEELDDMLREAVEEHLGCKRIIADLLEMSASDGNFDAKMKVLQEQIDHHIEEEEHELFPKAKKEIAVDELEAMGVEMEELFDALLPTEPRLEVPNETETAAPLE